MRTLWFVLAGVFVMVNTASAHDFSEQVGAGLEEMRARKMRMVAFAGIGEVAPELGDLNSENILPSVGACIRYRASEEQRVNLGIDYAVGKDSDAWYFRIGEAF
jgi:hypothetical protein